jgi:hypothetical protein
MSMDGGTRLSGWPAKESASAGLRVSEYLKRRSTGEASIEISINHLPQLFNSLDPSPFHQRDLDQDAEDYNVETAEEISSKHSLALVRNSKLQKTGGIRRTTNSGRRHGRHAVPRLAK